MSDSATGIVLAVPNHMYPSRHVREPASAFVEKHLTARTDKSTAVHKDRLCL